jgi:Htaa protein
MTTLPIPSLRSLRALASLVMALAVIFAATAAGASAAPANGEVVLTLKSGAQSSLLREGVKASPRSGKGKVQTVKLPVSELELGATSLVKTGATLTLSDSGKSAKLKDVELKIGATSTAISAKLDGKSKVFFRAKGAASVDGLSVRVSGPLSLTGSGAKALREALGLDEISGGKLGSTSILASVKAATPVPTPVVPDTPKKQPEEPKEAYPYAAECPVPAVEGNPGFGEAPGKVSGIAASPIFAPGIGQEVTGGDIDWGFKDSFRSYVLLVPPAGSLQALVGANPAGPTMGIPGSFWSFPTSGGEYEAGSAPDHSGDKLVVDGTGTVLFCKPGHGFNIALKNPTVTIDGENSRITATVGANMNGVWYPYQRADIATLDLSSIEPDVTDGGNTLAWEDVPVKLTANGELALGAIYPENEALDPITVETSLQRPLTTQCTIATATTEPPPTVDFTLAALPTLNSPVTGSGGTINWGLRRGTRNTVVLGGGAFTMLGGATESYPGNMGGGPAAPPAGGNGKFFRFPISSYQYEVGTADPSDDRLIATSQASIGLCNPNAGGYGVVLSRPTLVIDGANSRLVANAYSFQKDKGWAGGRVEVVDLDTSGINAVTATGTVSWGEVLADESSLTTGIPVAGAIQTEALSLAGLVPASTATGWDPVAAQIVLPTP